MKYIEEIREILLEIEKTAFTTDEIPQALHKLVEEYKRFDLAAPFLLSYLRKNDTENIIEDIKHSFFKKETTNINNKNLEEAANLIKQSNDENLIEEARTILIKRWLYLKTCGSLHSRQNTRVAIIKALGVLEAYEDILICFAEEKQSSNPFDVALKILIQINDEAIIQKIEAYFGESIPTSCHEIIIDGMTVSHNELALNILDMLLNNNFCENIIKSKIICLLATFNCDKADSILKRLNEDSNSFIRKQAGLAIAHQKLKQMEKSNIYQFRAII